MTVRVGINGFGRIGRSFYRAILARGANAGIELRWSFLRDAFTSRVTLGILAAYVLGKPVGIVASAFVTARLTRGRLRPPVGWGAVLGAGTSAGVGFTVTLLVATLAFAPAELQDAKVGVLSAALASALLSWIVFRGIDLLPARLRVRALLGGSEAIVDLADPVDPERDHIRGPAESPVTLVEYGDLECPYCGQAEPAVRALLQEFADITYVWRHLPLDDVHPHARLAAEGAEQSSERSGRFSRFAVIRSSLVDVRRFAPALTSAGLTPPRSTPAGPPARPGCSAASSY